MFTPCLVRPADGGGVPRLGHRLLDDFLDMVAARARPNTVLATAFDLKVFFSVVGKEPAEIGEADVLAFIQAQRQPRRGAAVVRIEDGEAGAVGAHHQASTGLDHRAIRVPDHPRCRRVTTRGNCPRGKEKGSNALRYHASVVDDPASSSIRAPQSPQNSQPCRVWVPVRTSDHGISSLRLLGLRIVVKDRICCIATGYKLMCVLLSADHDHRCFRRFGDRGADRAQPHASEPSAAMTADHDQLSLLGFIEQPAGWLVTDHAPPHAHVGLLFLPTREPFAQHLVSLVLVLSPVHAEDREDPDIAPRVQCHKIHPAS